MVLTERDYIITFALVFQDVSAFSYTHEPVDSASDVLLSMPLSGGHMPQTCISVDFAIPLRFTRAVALAPELQTLQVPLPFLMRFDDGSSVLQSTPIVIKFPSAHGQKHATLHTIMRWVIKTYAAMWKVQDLGWFHDPHDASIDCVFKNPGDDVWRVGFSF